MTYFNYNENTEYINYDNNTSISNVNSNCNAISATSNNSSNHNTVNPNFRMDRSLHPGLEGSIETTGIIC